MNLSSLKTEITKVQDHFDALKAANYKIYRDPESNLHLQFDDGRELKMPVIPFRSYQLEVQNARFMNDIKRFFLVRPRRAGKEVESWNILIQGAISEPGLYLMIYPSNVRARLVLWDGAITLPDGSSLKFVDMIPKELIARKPDESEMKIFLKNGSVIRILGSDVDPDKLRGINCRGAVFAEYAFQDPRVHQMLLPVFTQNGGWYILQTTFDGMNHAYRHMEAVKDQPEWYCRIDSVETLVNEQGDRYITDAMIDEDRKAGMPEFLILQEYYSIVQRNEEKMYFAVQMAHVDEDRRLCELDPLDKPIHTAWDLGVDDDTAITVFQIDDKGAPYILYFYENRGKTLGFYIDHLKEYKARRGLTFGMFFAPHDGANKSIYTSGHEPKNITHFGRELGVDFHIIQRPKVKIDAIQAMRQMIYRCRFNKDGASRLTDALSNYSKEYDKKAGMYKNHPTHDWCSHPVDSFQTMTLAFQEGYFQNKNMEVHYYADSGLDEHSEKFGVR